MWLLQTGAAWRFLPDKYPSPATCWRRLKQWEEQDVWLDAWRVALVRVEQPLLRRLGPQIVALYPRVRAHTQRSHSSPEFYET